MPKHVQVHSCRDAEQGIGGSGCLGIIHAVHLALAQIVFHSHTHVCSLAMSACKVGNVIPEVTGPSWGRHHGQVAPLGRLMQLYSPHVGEGIGKVQGIDGMHVHRYLSAHEACIALLILIGAISFCLIGQSAQVDIVAYPVGEDGCSEREVVRVVVHPHIYLSAEFCLQTFIAQLVLHTSLMHSVAA